MIWLIVVALLCVIASLALVFDVDDYDKPVIAFGSLVVSVIIILGSAPTIDAFYQRAAFDKITACEAKRMKATRQAFTTRVICVPAYNTTKNDTLTVNVP